MEIAAVIEDIHRIFHAVAALHEDCLAAQKGELLCRSAHIVSRMDLHPREHFRFRNIRSDQCGKWNKLCLIRFDGILFKKHGAGRSDHDRIDD